MLYAKEIIERYDHKGFFRVTKEIFAEDLNIMKNLAENGFQVNETCSHDLCVAPVPLASRRAETDKYLGLSLDVQSLPCWTNTGVLSFADRSA